MSEIDTYKVQQIVDNSNAVQISLIEDVQTEPLSQKQLIVENVSKKLDDDTKKQVMPLLEAILQAQPTIRVKSYAQTNISITMPKSDVRYRAIIQIILFSHFPIGFSFISVIFNLAI